MAEERDAREVGETIARLLEELRAQANPHAWRQVDELLRTVLDLYGRGLARVIEIASGDAPAEQLRANLVADPLLTSLLVLHGIHPVDTRTRIVRVLDTVRESLGPDALAPVFVSLDDDSVLRLRLEGKGPRHASTVAAVQGAIERAVAEAAPEVASIVFETAPVGAAAPGPLVQLNGRKQKTHPPPTWTSVDVGKMGPGEMRALEVGGQRLVVCSISGALYAYRDTCAACGSRIDAGDLQGRHLSCPSCGQRYDLRLAGRASDGRPLQLDPLPLLADATGVRIALPDGAA
ncbi:MAG TPA: Rieske 2Fe-2S domain-containing protein [Myxococcales bacterium]|nr:Rieske 2Fe-2S domain-containing protein [Myxococcales bacterium]